jgi:hypothetical protein
VAHQPAAPVEQPALASTWFVLFRPVGALDAA